MQMEKQKNRKMDIEKQKINQKMERYEQKKKYKASRRMRSMKNVKHTATIDRKAIDNKLQIQQSCQLII